MNLTTAITELETASRDRAAARKALREAVARLASEIVELTRAGEDTITVEGVTFETVDVTRQVSQWGDRSRAFWSPDEAETLLASFPDGSSCALFTPHVDHYSAFGPLAVIESMAVVPFPSAGQLTAVSKLLPAVLERLARSIAADAGQMQAAVK